MEEAEAGESVGWRRWKLEEVEASGGGGWRRWWLDEADALHFKQAQVFYG